MTAPLPDLPPGLTYDEHGLGVMARVDRRGSMLHSGIVMADDPGQLDGLLYDVRADVDTILRAAIEAAATAAGVVLPGDYDPAAVLRDGVRAHGWWWERYRHNSSLLVLCGTGMNQDDSQVVVHTNSRPRAWNVYDADGNFVIGGHEGSVLRACAAACAALGVPCPPVPGVDP